MVSCKEELVDSGVYVLDLGVNGDLGTNYGREMVKQDARHRATGWRGSWQTGELRPPSQFPQWTQHPASEACEERGGMILKAK